MARNKIILEVLIDLLEFTYQDIDDLYYRHLFQEEGVTRFDCLAAMLKPNGESIGGRSTSTVHRGCHN
ncbi:hypothetical protein [Mesobacillus campisalis]|uniref:hypothetical protein n=1 Tax=Mesobacillus campisalis TaxID=1408103 RepID=UPI0012E22EA0|nr:hypothetical protein [Mesobacillus campisalis]